MNWLAENYNWWRAGHIIFVIFWMAGLMFLPRQFVYQWQVKKGSDAAFALIEQQSRLIKIIMNPAIIMVWLFALLLLLSLAARTGGWAYLLSGFWLVKITLGLAMSAIHGFYAGQHKKFARQELAFSERFWRIMNEVPAIMAIAIVVIASVYI